MHIFYHCSFSTSTSMPIMASSQSTQASTNYKEAFSLFDKRGTGCVSLESPCDLLRACGQNPTLAEICDLKKQAGGDCEYSATYHSHSIR
jgi:Ca2+-binding EF-hand superfamily protein